LVVHAKVKGRATRLNRFSLNQLEQSGLTRDTIIRARRGERVHPSTCKQLGDVVIQLEREARREKAENW
jgi:hypothetical protein